MLFAATPDLLGDDEVKSIPGAPPRLDREMVGCPFAPRCDSAFDPCTVTHPRRLEVGPGHEAICHLNDGSRWRSRRERRARGARAARACRGRPAARGGAGDHPLPGRPRHRRRDRAAAAADGARRRGRLVHGRPRRDGGAGGRVGLRQDLDRADGGADGRLPGRGDPVPRPRDRPAIAARPAAAAARDPDDLPGSLRVAGSPLHGARRRRGAAARTQHGRLVGRSARPRCARRWCGPG